MLRSRFGSKAFVVLCVASPVFAGEYRFVRIADSADGGYSLDAGRHAAINNAGTVSVYRTLPGFIIDLSLGNGGPLSTVVTNSGGLTDGYGLHTPSLNDSGQLAFFAENAATGFGVYRATPGGGVTAIGVSGAGTFNGFVPHVSMNNSGNVAYTVAASGAIDGLYIGNGTANVRMYGTGVDGVSVASGPSLNNAGTVSFAGSLVSVGTSHLRGAGETPAVIGSAVNDFSTYVESIINEGGVVAFGATRFSSPTQGIFVGTGGSAVTTYVDTDGPYSNLPIHDSSGFAAGGYPALSNAGTVAFLGFLDAGGGGIFTGPDPDANKVIKIGDTLFGREIDNFFGGLGREAINDAGEIAFQVGFAAGGGAAVVKAIPFTPMKWSDDSDGTWSDSGNWIGGVPNAFHHDANFTDAITAPRTITVDGAFTVGSINFDNANGYTVTGPGSITLNDSTGGGRVEVQSGNHVISTSLVSAKTNLVVKEATSLTVSTSGLSGIVDKNGTGRVRINRMLVNELNINEGSLEILPNGTASGTSRANVVKLAGTTDAWTSVLDLNDNDMIIDHNGSSTAPLINAANQIKTGYASGAWSGNGITSSMANATTFALGYADNAVLGLTAFSGQSVDPSSVMVKYTYFGDSDLDGDVDIADLGNLATNWQSIGSWTGGDFDYNGTVNVNDLGLLASNWQSGVSSPLSGSFADTLAGFGLASTSVPEPGLLPILSAFSVALARRRR
jgi:hypothetical protein